MGWMEATAHAAVVAAVAGGLFLNTLEGEFVFDDRPAIVSNHDCHPDKNPLMQAWKNNFWGQEYAPLPRARRRLTLTQFSIALATNPIIC
eukprot:m.6129 g.6129  ORF g.6129 m.6129 type:complete len:90 (-) comp3802_c0_seq1:1754-2023(-)